MRYECIPIDERSEINVRRIIAAGLAVRALERSNPHACSSSDFTLQLGEELNGWAPTLIDTILDLVEREQRVARRFRSWRRRRAQRAAACGRAAARLTFLYRARTQRQLAAARGVLAFLPPPRS